jgi:protein-S-isoprenylcysteine O-methyltransferase Ste14
MSVLLIGPDGAAFLPNLGAGLMLFGFVIHFWAKLSLRRSFGVVAADRGIISGGLYSIVRHPMYFGYFISHLGYFLAGPTFWNGLVYITAWGFLIARVFAEEKLLSNNPEYQAYKEKVHYRFIPMVL